MLVKQISEIQSVIPFTNYSNINIILPAIKAIEEEYLSPLIDSGTLDALQTDYDLDPSLPTAKYKKLHEKILPAIVHLAILKNLPYMMVKVSSGNIISPTDTNSVPVKMWEYRNLESSHIKEGYKALDAMLAFMETNKADYPSWTASDKYTAFKKYFINTTAEFHAQTDINNSRLVFKRLVPTMENIELLHIKPILGTAFFDTLKTKIKAGNPTADEKEVIELIQKIVALRTIATGLNEISFNISHNGVVGYPRIYNDTITEDGVTDNVISSFCTSKETQAVNFTSLLIKTLKEKASVTVFPDYYSFLNSKSNVTTYNELSKGIIAI